MDSFKPIQALFFGEALAFCISFGIYKALDEIGVPKRKTDAKTLAARAARVFTTYKTEKYFS